MTSVLDRLGLRTTTARDAALAAVLAALTAAVLVPLTGTLAAGLGLAFSPRQRALTIALSVAQALAVAFRRTRPGLCLLLVTGLQVVLSVTVSAQASVRGLATVVAFYTAGTCLPLRRLARWAGAAAALELVGTPLLTLAGGPALHAWLGSGSGAVRPGAGGWLAFALSVLVVYGVAVAVGVVVATRRENLELLRARAEAAERARTTEARRAVEAERLRMARELHDIAAHHLTGLLVQAAAAERLVDRDSGAARDALHDVRDQGKQALDNLRSVVGMLRQDGRAPAVAAPRVPSGPGGPSGPADLDPVPGLAVLADLVDAARALGDPVTLEVDGTPYALAPVADVTAYRVTQEALSNARQHAPGAPVRVRLGYRGTGVRLVVSNPLTAPSEPSARAGYGLAGMHERAALVGGSLAAGPGPDASWTVSLAIPRPGGGSGARGEETP